MKKLERPQTFMLNILWQSPHPCGRCLHCPSQVMPAGLQLSEAGLEYLAAQRCLAVCESFRLPISGSNQVFSMGPKASCLQPKAHRSFSCGA